MIRAQDILALLSSVPRSPDEPLPQGATHEELAGFSERTGLELPPDLRTWLTLCNGPCVGPGGLFGIRPGTSLDMESHLGRYPAWSERGWIPVAGDGCGNFYVLATRGEFGGDFPVLFIDADEAGDAPAYAVASDIGHFLVSLLRRELGDRSWPFREDAVVGNDPAILGISGVPLPWLA